MIPQGILPCITLLNVFSPDLTTLLSLFFFSWPHFSSSITKCVWSAVSLPDLGFKYRKSVKDTELYALLLKVCEWMHSFSDPE